jgi:hypothetical protein
MMDLHHEFEAAIRSNSPDCLEGNAGCVETFVIESGYGASSTASRPYAAWTSPCPSSTLLFRST